MINNTFFQRIIIPLTISLMPLIFSLWKATLMPANTGELASGYWNSFSFWWEMHIETLTLILLWTLFTLFGKGASVIPIILFCVIVSICGITEAQYGDISVLFDYLHSVCINLGIYSFFFDKTPTNHNAIFFLIAPILIILLLSRGISLIIMRKKIDLALIFSGVTLCSIIISTSIFHISIFGDFLINKKAYCLEDAKWVRGDNSRIYDVCSYLGADCFDIRIQNNRAISTPIKTQPRSNIETIRFYTTQTPLHTDQINAINLRLVRQALIETTSYDANMANNLSSCSFKISDNHLMIIQDHQRFAFEAELVKAKFSRLCSFASWIWLVGMLFHLHWRTAIRKTR